MGDIETIREALLYAISCEKLYGIRDDEAIDAQKALRLFDEMVKAEPVAWMCDAQDGANCDATAVRRTMEDYVRFGRKITPLYTNPIACKPQEGMVMVRVDDLRKALGVASIPPDFSPDTLLPIYQSGSRRKAITDKLNSVYAEHPAALKRLAEAADRAGKEQS